MMFEVDIKSLEDFIYKRKTSPTVIVSFTKLSQAAHESHSSITRRYRKFLKFRRDDVSGINRAKAKRCCNMVKKHLGDLKEVRYYMYQNDLHREHPVFYNKITKWIDECDGIYSRYKDHIKTL